MNVYTRATGWGTFTTLVLLAGVLVLDVWLTHNVPILHRGLGYLVLQIAMAALLVKALRLIFKGGSPSSQD